MVKYIVDINLPAKFAHWNHPYFVHVKELNPFMPDREIWEFAKNINLAIITKDRDFYDRILLSEPPPKVIHIKLGNIKIREFHDFMAKNWNKIEKLVDHHKLILVYSDKLEGII